MGRVIYRIGLDEYVEFEDVGDDCTTYILSRRQMKDHLLQPRDGNRLITEEEVEERLARCDKHFCTSRMPGDQFLTPQEALDDLIRAINRHQHTDYSESDDGVLKDTALTRETFREQYAYNPEPPKMGEFFGRGRLPFGTAAQKVAWLRAGPRSNNLVRITHVAGDRVGYAHMDPYGNIGGEMTLDLKSFYGYGWERIEDDAQVQDHH